MAVSVRSLCSRELALTSGAMHVVRRLLQVRAPKARPSIAIETSNSEPVESKAFVAIARVLDGKSYDLNLRCCYFLGTSA